MARNRGCTLMGGCLTFVAGMVAGAALLVLALLAWALARQPDLAPLTGGPLPGGSDVEVVVSEAFVNQAVAEEVERRGLGELARIVVDIQPANRLEATLEGRFSLGGDLAATPLVGTEVRVGLAEGEVVVRIERVAIGPVLVDRASLPELVQPLFRSAEETMEQAIGKRVQTTGFEVSEVRSGEDHLTLGLRSVPR